MEKSKTYNLTLTSHELSVCMDALDSLKADADRQKEQIDKENASSPSVTNDELQAEAWYEGLTEDISRLTIKAKALQKVIEAEDTYNKALNIYSRVVGMDENCSIDYMKDVLEGFPFV